MATCTELLARYGNLDTTQLCGLHAVTRQQLQSVQLDSGEHSRGGSKFYGTPCVWDYLLLKAGYTELLPIETVSPSERQWPRTPSLPYTWSIPSDGSVVHAQPRTEPKRYSYRDQVKAPKFD